MFQGGINPFGMVEKHEFRIEYNSRFLEGIFLLGLVIYYL